MRSCRSVPGANDLVIAGGAESMSNAPFFSIDMRWDIKGDGLMLHDGLSRGRYTAGGKFHPVPGGHDRNGGKPAPRLRDHP